MKSTQWLTEDEAFSPINPDAMPPAPESDPMDLVTMDVPLLIRLFELMHETVEDDAELHHIATQLLNVSKSVNGPLTMEHYNAILNGDADSFINEYDKSDLRPRNNMANDILDMAELYNVEETQPTVTGYKKLKKFYEAVSDIVERSVHKLVKSRNLSKDKNLEY